MNVPKVPKVAQLFLTWFCKDQWTDEMNKFYPSLKDVELLDYKVRVLTSGQGTGSSVRVLIESGDKKDEWGTVGVSQNVIEASWQALVDSIDYKLYKDRKRKRAKGPRR